MRNAVRALTVALVSATLLGLPALPEGALRALQVDEARVSLAFASDGGGAWISTPVEGDHTLTGLTWDDPEDAPDEAEVRVRVAGEWSDWQSVELDDEHAPDPGSDEDLGSRGGTAPIVVDGADAVQFRVIDDGPPADLSADVVEVDDPDAARRVRERPGAADAAVGTPAIHPRSDWGGESCPGSKRSEPIEYGDRVEVLFVHHTAGHTSYAPSDVPAIVRAICSYHVNSRGWSDIGYNALIDRYGGIWEGRDGGLEQAVIGAHTGGFNSFSTGVALIGDHQNGGAPTAAARSALADYAAWKLDVHSVDPLGTTKLTSLGSSRWKEDTEVTFDNISGHRDASYTSCPGGSCYVLLDDFRRSIDERGGFRTFGGWAQAHTMELREDGTWEQPTFSFRFSHAASWVFELTSRDGTVLVRTTGTGTSGTASWNARLRGAPAPKDAYTATVRATRTSDGQAARPAVHVVELGGTLGEFDDVPTDNTFVADIEWLALSRITVGCNPPTNTRFCPDGLVTRGQMAAFLSRALQLPATEDRPFRDVPPTHTFDAPIASLARSGITRGCNPPTNDRFCPDEPVSRAEMAAFLVRALGLPAASHPGFRDVSPSNTFADDIRRLAAAGVTRGCNPPTNDRYCPSAPVTREQMAAFLHRALRS